MAYSSVCKPSGSTLITLSYHPSWQYSDTCGPPDKLHKSCQNPKKNSRVFQDHAADPRKPGKDAQTALCKSIWIWRRAEKSKTALLQWDQGAFPMQTPTPLFCFVLVSRSLKWWNWSPLAIIHPKLTAIANYMAMVSWRQMYLALSCSCTSVSTSPLAFLQLPPCL